MLFRHPRSLVVVLLAIVGLAALTLDRLCDTAEHQRETVLTLTRLPVVSKSLEAVQGGKGRLIVDGAEGSPAGR